MTTPLTDAEVESFERKQARQGLDASDANFLLAEVKRVRLLQRKT